MLCFLYLIRQGDSDHYKIGISSTPKERLCALQTGAPTNLNLVNTWKFDSREIAMKAEKMMHDQLGTCRLKGEWFLLTQHDLSLMVAMLTGFYHGLQTQKESAMVEIEEAIRALHKWRREEWS